MDVSLLLLMLMALSTNADSDDKHCVDVNQNGREKKFEVSCEEEGAVISNITVFSGTDYCPGNAGCCVGETPKLIVESLNCYWKRNCSVSFPRDIIIKSYAECSNCVGSQPRFMVINETRCFTPKNKTDGHVQQEIIDICDDHPTDITMDSGLLRSHRNYPWEYEPSKLISRQDPKKTCNKKLWLNADSKMLVSVHTIDVAEGDSLLVINGSTVKDIRSKTTLVYYDYQTRSVEFNFTIAQESNGGMGFVLCFKRIPTRDYDPTMNACDDVMNQSAVVKVTEADAECTRTWWGCPTPIPTPKTVRRCRKKDRQAGKCGKGKKKQNGQKKNKKKNRKKGKKKDKEKRLKSSKQRRSRKKSRTRSE